MLVDLLREKKKNLLCWLLSGNVLVFSLCHSWMHPFGVNGLWPLCGHMQPSPLLLNHVQDRLPENGSRGFYRRTVELWFTQVMWAACHSTVLMSSITSSVTPLQFLSSHVLIQAWYESISSTFAGVNIVGTLLLILTSYSYILFSIFCMHAGEGRRKAFSTCVSHLTAIILFYSTSIYTYLRPSSRYSLTQDKVASMFYTVVIPMLNLVIYSLRNSEVKKALWDVITQKRVPSFPWLPA